MRDARQAIGPVRIGIAGWSIPRQHCQPTAAQQSHLERYCQRFNAVEINSSFYRPHRRSTYERWAKVVPENFRFSVKVPKLLTHELGLRRCGAYIDEFIEGVCGLASTLEILLVQLPPSLEFEIRSARQFFLRLREVGAARSACEPRHISWFAPRVDAFLQKLQIARVAADPSLTRAAAKPGGAMDMVYYRLHGAPRMYYSTYAREYLIALSHRLEVQRAAGRAAWCIFDNTAEYAAWDNALQLQTLIFPQAAAQSS